MYGSTTFQNPVPGLGWDVHLSTLEIMNAARTSFAVFKATFAFEKKTHRMALSDGDAYWN